MQLSTKSYSSETWTRILRAYRPYDWTRSIWTRRRERSLGLRLMSRELSQEVES
jgi:hypothetical protein